MLTKGRMGEIALALAKVDLKKRGHLFSSAYKRELGNIAKVTSIPLKQLMEFRKILARWVFEENYGKWDKL